MRQFDHTSPLLDSARPRREFPSWRSEPAIIGFAAFSLLGAIAMSYYCRMSLTPTNDGLQPAAGVAVYEGKAVPRDDAGRPLGAGLASIVGKTTGTDVVSSSEVSPAARRNRTEDGESQRAIAAERDGQPVYSFPEFDALEQAARVGSASAVAANLGTQTGSASIELPAFGSFAPVPEPRAWSFAGVLLLLLSAAETRRRRAAHRS